MAGCSVGQACDWEGRHISPRAQGWALTQGSNHNNHKHSRDNGNDVVALTMSRTGTSSEHGPHTRHFRLWVHSALPSSVPASRELIAVLVLVIGQEATAWGIQ